MELPLNSSEPHWLSFAEFLPDPSTRPGFILTQIILALNTAFIFLGSFSSLVCVALSALWLIFRVFAVAIKPLDELVTHLGFDVPQGPRIDLAAVKADAVTLHWKPADDRKTSTRYEVQVNGVTRGKVSQLDTSLVISNLLPDHNYVFRIIAINSHDFKAASEPVRIRTKSASTNDFYTAAQNVGEQKDGASTAPGPIIRPVKILDTLSNTSAAPAMARETSNGPSAMKRVIVPRRASPATFIPELLSNTTVEDVLTGSGLEATQQQLTERLEEIGKDIAEAERQILEEEQEADQSKIEQVKERDELRAALKEKENASKDLRKKVSAAERENTATQNKRAAQERQLQQKISEKRKVKDDTDRWIRESKEMHDYVEDCATKKTNYLADVERQKQELRQKMDDEAQVFKQLEDEVKEKSQEFKKLEREKSSSPASGEDPHHDYHRDDDEEDRQFEEYMARMEEEYRLASMALEEAKTFCDSAYRAVQEAYERSRQQAFMNAPPLMPLQPVSRTSSTRQRRGLSDQFVTSPVGSIAFPMTSGAPFGNSLNMTAPHDAFGPSPSAFYSATNGMLLAPRDDLGMSSSEVERLTGGAPMSPSVGAGLIPADLLSNADDEEPSRDIIPPPGLPDPRQNSNEAILPGLGAFGGANMLPGLGVSNIAGPDLSNHGPQSPGSVSSRSPSVFASPQASASNLAFHSPEPAVDTDGRSIRSGRSIRPVSGGLGPPGSRFAQILGLDKFNRQRGKTLPDDGLALGKLQSHSMPKEAFLEENPEMGKRRNSSHSGNFFGNFKSGFGGSAPKPDDAESLDAKMRPVRRPFMGFAGKDVWGGMFGAENTRPGSSRPGSAHSNEVPRTLQEDTASWSLLSKNGPLNRQSPLGADWGQSGLPQPQPRTWGSRYPSRRPSAQVGPSGGVSFDIAEDEDDDPVLRPPMQAPIGTRPSAPIERPVTPAAALNPAAKDFKSLFQFGEGKKEKPEKEKTKKGKEAATSLSTPDPNQLTPISSSHSPYLGAEDMSPPQSRKSRDSRSVMTAESSADAASSRASLDRTPSHQLAEVPTPTSSVAGSVGKGGFMQRLSRKSSSGKFALPVFQKKARPEKDKMLEESTEDLGASVSSLGGETEDGKTREDVGRGKRTWSTGFLGFGKGKAKEDKGRESLEGTPGMTGSEVSLEAASDTTTEEKA
ncbi:hypothetical protein BDZ85DRAFT_270610 [Elsinoe ampelina]|uniref:Fibronectin type-III domain-containing protein n=1 Tax=Elsinoe ampelina TaxID=302913 RepID=A0A6A6FXV9_9PEZI|nr:hypothetical protein BDZ85DRAFT_270610 [Elsinoe ampelina]